MTSYKINQGWRVGGKKINSTIQNLWCVLEVKTGVKWNMKFLEPDARGVCYTINPFEYVLVQRG